MKEFKTLRWWAEETEQHTRLKQKWDDLSIFHISAPELLPSHLWTSWLSRTSLLGSHEGPWHSLELWEVPGGTGWSPCHALVPPDSCQSCPVRHHGVPKPNPYPVGCVLQIVPLLHSFTSLHMIKACKTTCVLTNVCTNRSLSVVGICMHWKLSKKQTNKQTIIHPDIWLSYI